MKRLIYAICLTLCLCACAPGAGFSYAIESDDQYYAAFAQSEGSYFLTDARGFLLRVDRQSGTASALCAKKDCLHDLETRQERILRCNAYIGHCEPPKYYDGALYYLRYVPNGEDEIMRAPLDGSGSSLLLTLRAYADSALVDAYPSQLLLHRGFLYIAATRYARGDASPRTPAGEVLLQYDLSDLTRAPQTLFETAPQNGPCLYSLSAKGPYIVFCAPYGEGQTVQKFYCYDTEKGTCTPIGPDSGYDCQNFALTSQGILLNRLLTPGERPCVPTLYGYNGQMLYSYEELTALFPYAFYANPFNDLILFDCVHQGPLYESWHLPLEKAGRRLLLYEDKKYLGDATYENTLEPLYGMDATYLYLPGPVAHAGDICRLPLGDLLSSPTPQQLLPPLQP